MEQKEAIQLRICEDVSSNAQTLFGRSMNILNLLQVVKRVELGIKRFCHERKTYLMSLLVFHSINNQTKIQTMSEILDLS